MRIKDFKTSVKLTLGFGIVIFFTAVVCYIGWIGTNNIYKQNLKQAELGSIRANFNLARLYYRTFAH